MTNYPYIIASFPDLLLDFERHPLDVGAVIAEVKGQLSESDCRLVDWLEFGQDGNNLNDHFYRGIRKTRNRFLIGWFDFDRQLRLAKVAYLDEKPVGDGFPEANKAAIIFKVENLYQREKLLDRLCWDKAAELVDFDILDMNVILSLLQKLHIVARWNKLDPATGAKLFKELVNEVRGTFKGINSEQF